MNDVTKDTVIEAVFDRTNEAFKVVVNAPTEVTVGDVVEVTVGVEQAALQVYAQDLTIAYESDKLIYTGVEAIDEKTEIVETVTQDNQVRVLFITDEGTSTNEQLIKVKFVAHDVEDKTATMVEIMEAILGVIEEVNSEAVSSTVTAQTDAVALTINKGTEPGLDTTALTVLINEAKALIANAVEGNAPGNYPQAAIDALQEVIDEMEKAINVVTTQEELDRLVATLTTAIETFRAAQIPSEPTIVEDINKDGKVDIADLALVAYYYGRTNQDPDWEAAQKADIDNSGRVDIDDLAKVANKILQ